MEKEEIGEEEEEEGFCILAGEEATKLLLAAGGRIWSQHCPRALPHTALQDLVVFHLYFTFVLMLWILAQDMVVHFALHCMIVCVFQLF